MNAKGNALEIIRFGAPERIAMGPPCHGLAYLGCNHEGFRGGGHHLRLGSKWEDIRGTVWHREHEGVMGFPRGHPLADLPTALRSYRWPDSRTRPRVNVSFAASLSELTGYRPTGLSAVPHSVLDAPLLRHC